MARAVEEVVGDKGIAATTTLVALNEPGLRRYVSEPERGQRCWQGKKTGKTPRRSVLRRGRCTGTAEPCRLRGVPTPVRAERTPAAFVGSVAHRQTARYRSDRDLAQMNRIVLGFGRVHGNGDPSTDEG